MRELKKEYFEKAIDFFLIKEDLPTNRVFENEIKNNIEKINTILCETMLNCIKGNSLFRYASFEKYERDKENLKNNKFYLTSLDSQNDPFEFAQNTSFNKIFKDVVDKKLSENITYDKFEDIFKERHDNLVYEINKMKYKFSIKSFCEQWDNTLLWSHYANSHKGYCVEYDCIDLFSIMLEFLLPVIYEENMSNLKLGNNINDITINNLYRIVTKSICWEYEKEWRFVRVCESDDDHYCESPNPKSIYLGCNVEEKYKLDMLEFCRERNITLYKVKCCKENYVLDREIIFKGNDWEYKQ